MCFYLHLTLNCCVLNLENWSLKDDSHYSADSDYTVRPHTVTFRIVSSKCLCVHTIHIGCGQSACGCCFDMEPREFCVKELTAVALLLDED